ncbi:hypothetical protein C8J55DRAFT_446974 [Lentinula edodes]|uniref:C2 domain-containing protein n=1 Tax=Lentinula lateritia TaxID=40482 RepID=A0A9W9E0M3_9AGAR|nr:hypothetical protein C8J55DRAFT_446974 [Lentinula edodes]
MSGDEEEIGTLIIVVLKAQNLNDKHFFKQDVYAQVSLNGITKKTKIDYKGGQHPVWDSELRFSVKKGTAKKYRELEVSCFAKEHRDDTLLGEARVDMTPTLKSGEFDEWVPLQVNDVQRGDIYLEITYYSNGPAPPPSAPLTSAPLMSAHPPSSLLAPPAATNLSRRPSKMSPADRLYRPTSSVNLHASAQQQQQQPGPRTPPKEGSLPIPGSYPPTTAVSNTIPAAVPHALKSGLAAVPSTLKPGPVAVPSTLQPGPTAAPSKYTTGPTRVSPKQQQLPLPATVPPGTGRAPQSSPPAVPSILRPGNPQSDPHPSRRSSASPPGQSRLGHSATGPVPYVATHTPNPYTSSSPAPSNYNHNGALFYSLSTPVPVSGGSPIPYASPSTPVPPSSVNNRNSSLSYPSNVPSIQPHTHRQSSNPSSILDWNSTSQPEGPLSFPVPNFPGAPSIAVDPTVNGYGNGFYNSQPYQSPVHVHQRTASFSHIQQQPARTSSSGSTDLPDPYLIARYQTPLPLPTETQGASSSSFSSHHRRTASAEPTSYRPAPPPVPAKHPSYSTSTSPPPHNLNIPLSPPPSEPTRSRTPVDESRLQALRQAEQEAARRREQEERDAELARILDQEEAEREEKERTLEQERQRQRELEKVRAPPVSLRKPDSPPPYAKAEEVRKAQEEKDAELARQLDRELNL